MPHHIAGAGAIIHDAVDRILVVKPSYRNDTWEIPGGGLGAGEDPLHTARHEVKEELGIDLAPGRLLVVVWVPEQPDGRPPLVNHFFDGGLMSQDEAENRLHPDRDELAQWRPATHAEWDTLLAPHMARRLRSGSRVLAEGSTVYLKHGCDPTRPES
ncbi:NUDIX domain-containing protein [Streptomyces sp. NPDC057580]|uniref:NUDIX domain-containing protein n=1 Tax=Streptomyces sp. NPDC057580 TaxID=3346173 RepID=UPI00367CE626